MIFLPIYLSSYFSRILRQTAKNFKINELSGDKAYSSRANLELINELGAVPYIPFRKNATGRAKNSPMWKKMYYYFEYKHEEFLEHYYKRSNAETTFHMIKSKFGDSVRSKGEVAQINEVCRRCTTFILHLLRHFYNLAARYFLGVMALPRCVGSIYPSPYRVANYSIHLKTNRPTNRRFNSCVNRFFNSAVWRFN